MLQLLDRYFPAVLWHNWTSWGLSRGFESIFESSTNQAWQTYLGLRPHVLQVIVISSSSMVDLSLPLSLLLVFQVLTYLFSIFVVKVWTRDNLTCSCEELKSSDNFCQKIKRINQLAARLTIQCYGSTSIGLTMHDGTLLTIQWHGCVWLWYSMTVLLQQSCLIRHHSSCQSQGCL